MKILKRFIPVSLFLLVSGAAFSCGPWYYSAADNRIYRLLPPLWQPPTSVTDDFEAKNILAWSRQTGCRDTAAIRQALYTGWNRFSDWEAFLHGMTVTSSANHNPMTANRFCRHLVQTSDTDAVRLLCWSKTYSNIRNAQRSPWYYNSGINTDEHRLLRELYNKVLRYKPAKRYADRYTFLALKCAWALGEDSTAVALWRASALNRKGNLFCNEARDYAARSLTRMGRQAEADALYFQNGDYRQLLPSGFPLHTRLRLMLQVCPNSRDIAPLLQDYLTELDIEHAATYQWKTEEDYFQTDSMLAVARTAIGNPRVRNKAMWLYAAACILDFNGKPREALAMLDGAKTGDAFLRKSVRILTFYLRSRTEYPSSDFVNYALGEVKWLDGELQREWNQLPDSTRDKITHVLNWRWVGELINLYAYSALRRILLEDSVGLAWQLSRYGYGVKALQLANLADNRIVMLTDNAYIQHVRRSPEGIYSVWYKRSDGHYHDTWLTSLSDTATLDGHDFNFCQYAENWNDYSNGLFCLADRLDAATLAEYLQRLVRPANANDRWFNERSYTNLDYWRDIVGTHYLRERNYRAAALHLKYISPSYQRLMNVRCSLNPFGIDRTTPSHDSTRYKYHFAQRMDSLQRVMLREADPDRRGLAMLEYSIGLENSFGMCWWLTSYDKGWIGPDLTDIDQTEYAAKARTVVLLLRRKAQQILQTDEARARYHLRLGQYSTVRRRYAATATARHLALVCDNQGLYRDYPQFNRAQFFFINPAPQPPHAVSDNPLPSVFAP